MAVVASVSAIGAVIVVAGRPWGADAPVSRSDPPPAAVGAASATVVVHVDSRPPGASVHLGDRDLGVTPARLELPRGEDAVVELELPGYVTTTHEVSATADERLVIALIPEPPQATAEPVAPSEPAESSRAGASRRPTARRAKRKRSEPATSASAEPEPRPRFRRFE